MPEFTLLITVVHTLHEGFYLRKNSYNQSVHARKCCLADTFAHLVSLNLAAGNRMSMRSFLANLAELKHRSSLESEA